MERGQGCCGARLCCCSWLNKVNLLARTPPSTPPHPSSLCALRRTNLSMPPCAALICPPPCPHSLWHCSDNLAVSPPLLSLPGPPLPPTRSAAGGGSALLIWGLSVSTLRGRQTDRAVIPRVAQMERHYADLGEGEHTHCFLFRTH